MHWPQFTIAAALLANSIAMGLAWLRLKPTAGAPWAPPLARFYARHGWMLSSLPVAEALILSAGGFWK